MKQKTKLYLYAGLCVFGSFVVMIPGMSKMASVSFDDFWVCFLDKDCFLYRGLITLIFISFANHYIYQARMIESKKMGEEKNFAILGYGGIAAMFFVYAVFEILSMRSVFLQNSGFSKAIVCLFDTECLFPEFFSVLIMFYMSGFFINVLIKQTRILIPDVKEEEAGPETEIKEEFDEVKTDETMMLFIKILIGAMVLFYLLAIFSEFVLTPPPEGFPPALFISGLLFILYPFGIIGAFIALVIVGYFSQKQLENTYPALFKIMTGWNFVERYKYRKEIKALKSKRHKVMGYYNRIAARVGWALIVLFLTIIPAGTAMQKIGVLMGVWE